MILHYEKLIFMKGILKYWRLIVSLAQLTLSQSNNNYFAICILLEILEGFDYWSYVLEVTQSFICLSRTHKLLSRDSKSLLVPGMDLGKHLSDFWYVILLETAVSFLDWKECFKKNLVEKKFVKSSIY